MGYDRYNKFRVNGEVGIPCSITLTPKKTDYFEEYIKGKTRLDLLSYDYYGDSGYDWLILMANPELPDLEYLIPNGSLIRIPYPLNLTLEDYNSQIEKNELLNGIDKL